MTSLLKDISKTKTPKEFRAFVKNNGFDHEVLNIPMEYTETFNVVKKMPCGIQLTLTLRHDKASDKYTYRFKAMDSNGRYIPKEEAVWSNSLFMASVALASKAGKEAKTLKDGGRRKNLLIKLIDELLSFDLSSITHHKKAVASVNA